MTCSVEARIVAIDAAMVFVATDQYIASFRRDALPSEWRQHLKHTEVNGRVAALLARKGVPAANSVRSGAGLAVAHRRAASVRRGSVTHGS